MTTTHPVTLIIGDPVDHSLSPSIHNAGYAALSLPYVMKKVRVSLDQLTDFFESLRTPGVAGLAITMPLKVAASSLVDKIDTAAREIGAINTVYRSSEGELQGTNTDWIGIANPLKAKGSLSGQRVAIIGAGGAALAALYACKESSAKVTLFNRSEEKARLICTSWGAEYEPLSNISLLTRFDIVINATPVGMSHLGGDSNSNLFSQVAFGKSQILFETIYSPLNTPLILRAQECGATTITGDQMFAEQAIAQFQLHTGHPAPRDVMVSALKRELGT